MVARRGKLGRPRVRVATRARFLNVVISSKVHANAVNCSQSSRASQPRGREKEGRDETPSIRADDAEEEKMGVS